VTVPDGSSATTPSSPEDRATASVFRLGVQFS
jgi:hypothetical protein